MEKVDPDPNELGIALTKMGTIVIVHREGDDVIAEHPDLVVHENGNVTCDGPLVNSREGYGYDAVQESEGIVRFSPAIDN